MNSMILKFHDLSYHLIFVPYCVGNYGVGGNYGLHPDYHAPHPEKGSYSDQEVFFKP